MDTLENEIKTFIAGERLAAGLGKRASAGYPAEKDFYLFVADQLSGTDLKKMLDHLKAHPEDQKIVVKAHDLLSRLEEAKKENVPETLLQKVRARIPQAGAAVCPHCHKPVTPFKKPLAQQKLLNLLWLAAGTLLFVLSFLIRHFYVQLVVVGALCIAKWIVDQKSTKTQIMIYKALSDEPGEKSPHLHRVESHL